jgi:hypothetical protein
LSNGQSRAPKRNGCVGGNSKARPPERCAKGAQPGDLVTPEHTRRFLGEQDQQLEFGGGQIDEFAVARPQLASDEAEHASVEDAAARTGGAALGRNATTFTISAALKPMKDMLILYNFRERVDRPRLAARRARWKWRGKPLKRLFSAMEMARCEDGGR